MNASMSNMLAKVILSHEPDTGSSLERSIFVEKRIASSIAAIKEHSMEVQREIQIILCGKLQNPVLACRRAIHLPGSEVSVIPLVARLG
jgi:hypothetical protein